ncbi:hypothetical protein [Wenjunlia tyrosinilytica]|uniref:hypothetical protein n=1 Tax=Wenjunlia tyrosinilytica TaxID=1544741 RepID=UPI00166A1B99|nr:hypothetical protein [Wenjunlia tyrosinilytica]
MRVHGAGAGRHQREHKLGRQAGKRGMGVGVALGLIAAIPTGGLSLVGGVLGGRAGCGIIGEFFHKGLKKDDRRGHGAHRLRAHTLLRNTIYFDGHGTAQALIILLLYLVIAGAALGLLDWFRTPEIPVAPETEAEAAAVTVPIGAAP